MGDISLIEHHADKCLSELFYFVVGLVSIVRLVESFCALGVNFLLNFPYLVSLLLHVRLVVPQLASSFLQLLL